MRPAWGARIQDLGDESWIREERKNDVFPFPWSEKSRIGLFATLSEEKIHHQNPVMNIDFSLQPQENKGA